MKIVNFSETKRRFDESGRAICKFAKAHGLANTTLSQFLRGKLPYSKGPNYEAMLNALREAGCLVEEEVPESDETKAA